MSTEFTKDDILAMRALLARVIKGEDDKAAIEEQRQSLNAQFLEVERRRSAAQSAFAAFGFSISDKDLWSNVRSAMGNEAWNEAFVLGGRAPQTRETEDDEDAQRGQSSSEETPIDAREKEQVAEENISEMESASIQRAMPTIREIVISQLASAGASGMKAATIRDYIASTYDHVVHEKTVGMTLYRLSKEGAVRRDGRVWFASASQEANAEHRPSSNEEADGVFE